MSRGQWAWSIAGGLIVTGVSSIVALSFTSGKADAATEVRLLHVEQRLDANDVQLREMREVLSDLRAGMGRVEQRVTDMDRRLERVEQKLDAPARRER